MVSQQPYHTNGEEGATRDEPNVDEEGEEDDEHANEPEVGYHLLGLSPLFLHRAAGGLSGGSRFGFRFKGKVSVRRGGGQGTTERGA